MKFLHYRILSGWRDSNSRPPAPKAGILTGLNYIPHTSFSKASAKVLLFFDMTKYFARKMQKKCILCYFSFIFHFFLVILHDFWVAMHPLEMLIRSILFHVAYNYL